MTFTSGEWFLLLGCAVIASSPRNPHCLVGGLALIVLGIGLRSAGAFSFAKEDKRRAAAETNDTQRTRQVSDESQTG